MHIVIVTNYKGDATVTMARIPDNEIQQAIKMFNEGMSITKIAKELHRDAPTLSKRMKETGANIIQHCNKKSVDSTFFDNWNEESAYWLGFIFADGSLDLDNKLEICIKDKEHIEKFKEQIKSDHKISERVINGSSYYRINMRDKYMGEKLRSLGVLPNKTYGWTMPNVPIEYIHHFIRGLYDGDGNLNVRGSKTAFRIVSYDISILENLMQIILEQVPCVKNHIRIYNYENRVPELNISSKKALNEFLNWLYKDATIYLDRKYQKYLSYAVLGENHKNS